MEHYDEVVEVKRKTKAGGRSTGEKSESTAPGKPVLQQIEDLERTTTKRPGSSLPKGKTKTTERATSESESSDSHTDDNAKPAIDGFDYTIWANLDLPKELKDLYQYIAR